MGVFVYTDSMALDCVGIDFGTTNTCVSVREGKRIRVLEIDPLSAQSTLMRTLIYIPNRNESFYGKNAIDQYFDRGMEGRFFQSVKKLLPNPDFTGTSVFGIRLGVEALVARFLSELKKRIEKEVGPIDGVPIHFGRPARYSLEPEREELAVVRFKKAIELAGFKNISLIDEPTAAALSSTRAQKEDALVLVCDLGGGTSDFTLFSAKNLGAVQALSVYGVPVAGDSLDTDFFKEKLNVFFGSEVRYQRPFSSNVLTLPSIFVRILPKWHHHAFLKERSTWEFILSLRRELVDEKQTQALENLITLVEENLGYMLHQRVENLKVSLSDSKEAEFSFKSYPIDIRFLVGAPNYDQMIEPSVVDITEAALKTLELGKCTSVYRWYSEGPNYSKANSGSFFKRRSSRCGSFYRRG